MPRTIAIYTCCQDSAQSDAVRRRSLRFRATVAFSRIHGVDQSAWVLPAAVAPQVSQALDPLARVRFSSARLGLRSIEGRLGFHPQKLYETQQRRTHRPKVCLLVIRRIPYTSNPPCRVLKQFPRVFW